MRCVVFELAGGGGHICAPPPGRAKVAQTPGRARVNDAVSKVRNVISSQTYLRQTRPDVVRRLDSDDGLARLADRVASLEAAVRSVAQTSGVPRRQQDRGARLCL